MQKFTIKALTLALAMGGSLAVSAGTAQAAVIYDNFTSPEFTVGINDYSYTGVFRSDTNQTINGIGSRTSVDNDADLKFVLFDLGNGAGPQNTGTLVFSQQKHFIADSSFDYDYSDPFSFAMTANRWYAVGAISNGNVRISYDQAGSVNPGPTFTAFANRNVNFTNFANPSNNFGFGCCNVHYQLLSGNTGVPEPMTWALMLAGFGLTGSALRRRRAIAA